MLKRAAEHHRKASKHLAHAAHYHGKAASDHETGRHETAVQYARTASCHGFHASRHALKALQAHVDHVNLLMHEINHRSKNMLGLVQAIARETAATGKPEDFMRRFTERVEALTANQDLLVRNEWRGVDVEDLVRAQLAHFADLLGSLIALHGPRLQLSATAAQAIGLALHELATNAGKYGALSVSDGRIDVGWGLDNDMFEMEWIEHNGPPVSAPQRRGFGTTVIEAMTERSVDGAVDLDYAPSGLTWHLICAAANALEPAEKPSRQRVN
jgi:two-component sensor histidine kinase